MTFLPSCGRESTLHKAPVGPRKPGQPVAEDQHPMQPRLEFLTALTVENELVIADQRGGEEHADDHGQQPQQRSLANGCHRHHQENRHSAGGQREQLALALLPADRTFRHQAVVEPVADSRQGCGSSSDG